MPSGHGGRPGFNARNTPIVQGITDSGDATELIRPGGDTDYFTALLSFDKPKRARAFANLRAKYRRYHMDDEEFHLVQAALAYCAVKGDRARLLTQTLTGVLIERHISGKDNKGRDTAETTNK